MKKFLIFSLVWPVVLWFFISWDKHGDAGIQAEDILSYDTNVESGLCSAGSTEFQKPVVSLTFDDGWQEIYDNAIPVLNKAGIRSTQFISTAVLKSNDILGHYMSIENVLEIERAGHEIASHAVDHTRFAELSRSEIIFQFIGSKNELKRMGVASVDTFSPPYAKNTGYSDKFGRESGLYSAIRMSDQHMNGRNADRFHLSAYQLENWMTFPAHIKNVVDDAVRRDKWLIFIFHQIAKPDYQFYTAPEDLIQLVNYLAENEIPVMTVRDVIKQCYPK